MMVSAKKIPPMESRKITDETKSETPPWDAKRNKPKGALLRKLITWTGILGLVALVGYGLMPKPIEVELGKVVRGPLTVHVVEEGKTRIRNRYVVSAPIAGQMRRVPLKAGDEVIAGKTVITTIEPVMASLLDPRTRVQAEARIKTADAARARAVESLDMAKTAEKFAVANWERTQKLKTSGSISETDRDNAERDYEMKQREVRAADFALKVAEFELEQAKAALLQLDDPGSDKAAELPVFSPVSGRVLKVMQESAMVVTPGLAILEVGDPADIEIEAEILSRDAVAITKGAKVQVEQWGDDQPLDAIVRLVEPAAFTKVSALGVEEQRVYVLSDLKNPPDKAKALGDRYRVEVRVAVWHEDDVLLVPSGAPFREGVDWKTFVYESGKAKKVSLEAGRSDGRMTEVIKGLELGTQVLLHPPDTVKDGVAVTERKVE